MGQINGRGCSCHEVVASTTTWIGLSILIWLAIGFGSSRAVAGTNGTWTNTYSGGLWSNSANWSGGAVADGADATADFSTLDIAADYTVHLDSSRTIGNLIFGDTSPSNNWTVDNNG